MTCSPRRRVLACALVGAALLGARGAQAADDDEKPGLRIAAASVEKLVASLRPDPLRAADEYYRTEVEKALAGIDPQKIDLADAKHRAAMERVTEMYRRGGFESVKALAKTGKIGEGPSRQIAAFRNAMVQEALASMASRLGEVRVNDFSTAPTAQSDIDQTFFPVEETDSDGRRSVRRDPGGREMDGAYLKEQFGHEYERLFGVDPDRMEVSSHAREATVPDWRTHPDTDDFAVKLARGADALMKNPEAYFLEGAFRRQVDRRSFESKEKLFRTFRPLATKTGETAQTVVKLKSGDVGVTAGAARFEVYRDVKPEWRRGYAFGACVGNLLFFGKHARPEELRERAKYVGRSVEDGIASLAIRGPSGEVPLFFDLDDAGRRDLLRRALPDLPADRLERMMRTYRMADDVQFVVGGDGKRVKRTDFSSAAQAQIFRPILDEMAAEKLGPGRTAADVPAAELDDWVREAASRYQKESHALLLENCVHAAGARVRDWLNPDRIDPDKLPASDRERFARDPEGFAKRLRLSALSELADAFHVLPPEIVDRIVAAETDPSYRAALEDVRANAELRRELLRKSAAARTRERLAEIVKEIRTKGARLSEFVPEVKTRWQAGYYAPGAVGLRSIQAVKETFGWHFEADFRSLENAGRKVEGKFDARKLAANACSLGGADALVSILRQGQQGGWDPNVVVWAVGLEFLSNVPGVAPALAVKGALFDGEIEGAAVLVAAYFYPGVGQAYMVWNVAKGVLELVDCEISGGIADLLYQGYVPDKAAGVRGFLGRYAPGRIAQDVVVSASGDVVPPTLLWFVEAPTLRLKRLRVFDHYDDRIGVPLRGQGLKEEEIDAKRRQLAPALFAKEVNDFCDARPGTKWGDDPAVRRRFEQLDASLTGKALRGYLARPDVREQLRDRMVKDYVAGLQRLRVEEGAQLADDLAKAMDEGVELLDRVRDGLGAARAAVRADAPLVSGLPDFPDLDEAFLLDVLRPQREDGAEVKIVAPEGGIALGDTAALKAEVRAPPGRFTKPYAYEWKFPSAAAQPAGDDEGHGFVKGESQGGPLLVRVEVKDARGETVGAAEASVPVVKANSASERVATYRVLKQTLTWHSSENKQPGDRMDVVIDTFWLPVPVTDDQSAEKTLEERRRRLTEQHGPPDGGGGAQLGSRRIASWAIEIDDAVKLPTPFDASAVPKPKREVKKDAGPEVR